MHENFFLSIFNQKKKNFDKKQTLAEQKKRRGKKRNIHIDYSILYTLYLHYSHKSSLRSVFSPFVNIKRDVYDNFYASRDEEKRTDDEYQEELLFVFCFRGRESFSFVVHIISSICIGDGVN